MQTKYRTIVLWIPITLALLALGLWNLEGPLLWWDEGWTLSVARNWVELHRYVRLRDGIPVVPGLEAAFTVTLPVAWGMQIFGVGLWQGRLFGVVCSILVLWLLFALAQRLYNQRIAWATVIVAILLTPHPQNNPIIQGRQVFAELPMLVYLLLGYLALWWVLNRRWWALILAIVCFGMAWVSKAQTAPFLSASLLFPAFVALIQRRWLNAAALLATLVGAYLVNFGLRTLAHQWLIDPTLPQDPITDLIYTVAFVPTQFHRIYALKNLLILGLPSLIGIIWALVQLRQQPKSALFDLRLVLLTFAGSWFAWFTFLSVGVPRYIFVPIMVSTIFVAALLYDLSVEFDPKIVSNIFGQFRKHRWAVLRILTVVLFLELTVALTLMTFKNNYFEDERAVQRVAGRLNALPVGTRIETYESELHFFLDQPYHYPYDQLHVELNRRSLLFQDVAIDYDPLVSDPDILVVGTFTRENHLYDDILATEAFRFWFRDGVYEVYQRVR